MGEARSIGKLGDCTYRQLVLREQFRECAFIYYACPRFTTRAFHLMATPPIHDATLLPMS